eukprot:GGOE01018247.1.p1 GENE.GGOE01018247.1~~GGOE01018247.1.p1  ORF type:complete len:1070 (+),score=313.51 GGOE01018247.1:91-3300(+)
MQVSLDVPDNISFPQEEEKVLKFWKDNDCFKTSLKKSEGRTPYSFYDGPPFATGLPHYGHILAGTIKDVVTRWATQTGHHVERRFGWDCHGLPIEFEIEKQLKIKTREEVMAFGIANYNNACRSIVQKYAKEWETIVGRTGRWIDFENDYKTMNLSFMESVWWVFSQLHKKGLVYRGVKVMPYSTGCTTTLSNFEANMNYQDTTDPSVTITFPLEEDPETSFVAWTTTPWTLPSNLGLCVNPEYKYLKIKDKKTGKLWILAEARLCQLYDLKKAEKSGEMPYEVLEEFKGTQLEGKPYVPLFDYFKDKKAEGAFRVLLDSYVTSDSGTGIVHQAPGFGEDDYRVCLKYGIVKKGQGVVCPIDASGRFTPEITDFAGQYIKDADGKVCDMIKSKGRLLSKNSVVHSYPFCWRSQQPLIYKACASWFVEVEAIKDKLLTSSDETYWVPDFVHTKRFNNWLADARDWCVSRSRYWGTPLPIWHSEDWEEIVVIGSVAELEERSGKKFTDIHREFLDDVRLPSQMGKGELRRVEEVFDCWFESGSMPYAQCHYPFENQDTFHQTFPADFIAEGLDQTRGWFYTLLVLSTALFEKAPFKNLIVNGLVLAEDRKKMSKSLRNYPDPMEVINEHSADAIRLYLINSPVVRAEPLAFKKDGVKEIVKDVLLPLWNVMKFFLQNHQRFQREGHQMPSELKPTNTMDQWILASSNHLIEYVVEEMRKYRLYTVVPGLLKYLDNLTNWYVRMNRRRLKGDGEGPEDCGQALATLYSVLMTAVHLLSPFIPFITESMYQRLSLLRPEIREESVHYCLIPKSDKSLLDPVIERKIERMQTVIELARVIRAQQNIALKMPVQKVIVIHNSQEYVDDVNELREYVMGELNCMELEVTAAERDYVRYSAEPNLGSLGKRLKGEAKAVGAAIKQWSHDDVMNFIRSKQATVLGHQLGEDDVKVVKSFAPGIEDFLLNGDGQVLVMMDKTQSEQLLLKWVAREFVNRIQKLRKKAGLQPSDSIKVYYENTEKDEQIANALAVEAAYIAENMKNPCFDLQTSPISTEEIIREEQELNQKKLLLILTRP